MPARFKWMTPIKPGKPHYIPMREEIRQALIEQSLSPTALAKELGLDRFYLINYLEGKKHVMEAERAAKILSRVGLSPGTPLAAGKSKRRKAVETQGVRFGGYVPFERSMMVEPDPRYPAQSQVVFEAVESIDEWRVKPGDLLLVLATDYPLHDGARVLVRHFAPPRDRISVHTARIYDDNIELWPAGKSLEEGEAMAIHLNECEARGCEVVGVVLKTIKGAGTPGKA